MTAAEIIHDKFDGLQSRIAYPTYLQRTLIEAAMKEYSRQQFEELKANIIRLKASHYQVDYHFAIEDVVKAIVTVPLL